MTEDFTGRMEHINERPTEASSASLGRPHSHLITRHAHPEWHGHCEDPFKRGWKPCGRPHWHFLWRHQHTESRTVYCARHEIHYVERTRSRGWTRDPGPSAALLLLLFAALIVVMACV